MFSDVLDKEEDRMNLIREMLKTLTKREELVLRLYFGILYGTKTTLSELGQDFEITQGSVRRIKNKGILKVINRVTNKELFESGLYNIRVSLYTHKKNQVKFDNILSFQKLCYLYLMP